MVAIFCLYPVIWPLKPKHERGFILFHKEKKMLSWVQCNSNCNGASKERRLIILCYTLKRTNFLQFVEQLTSNIDNVLSVSNRITLLAIITTSV